MNDGKEMMKEEMTTEDLLKAKIPGEKTGITVRRGVCNVCCSAFYCGQLVYLKDGKVIKVEGDPDHPLNHGKLCTKGQSTKEYIYSDMRIKSPLKRVDGKLVETTWEDALSIIARKLNGIKKTNGAESVAFYSGIEKWYQPFLERLAYSFGSPNFCNASGTCFEAVHMAWILNAGRLGLPDAAHAGCYVAFSLNQFYSRFPDSMNMEKLKKKGLKFVIVDPRRSPSVERLADIHLQNYPGTDGAVALGMANLLIEKGKIDREFIHDHVYGFAQFSEYVKQFTPQRVEELSGVRKEDLVRAVDLMVANMPISFHESVSPIVHHINGMQNYRAMTALCAITGCYDKLGGNRPRYNTFAHQGAGFKTHEFEFIHATKPKNLPPAVGHLRFPLWAKTIEYGQSTDLARQILEGTPYPIKGLIAFGMNFRMFPGDEKIREALGKLDLFVDVDLFMTESAKMADIVLPACSILERGEFKQYRGGLGIFTKPLIKPLYQSRSDFEIIHDLAEVLDLDDPLLRGTYEDCMAYILQGLGVTIDDLKSSDLPIKIPGAAEFAWKERKYTEEGYETPTKKFELYSTVIANMPKELHLDPLPTYRESLDAADPKEYPLILFTGSSIPNAYNSRLSHVPSEIYLRKDPQADISLQDAERLGIAYGDMIEIATPKGKITLKANPSHMIKEGTVSIYHDYAQADVNSIIDWNHLDPYSGFPGYKTVRCRMTKVGQ